MAKYRKKPVVIEAEQWRPLPGTGTFHVPPEMPIPPAPHYQLRRRWWGRWKLRTLEGWMKLTPNDWIITGVKGELYPCKPDVFEATYERV